MAMTPKKVDTGKPSDQKAEFIVVKIGYECQLIFPIHLGVEFLGLYSQARQWKSGYKEPTQILPSPPEVSIRYLTRQELAQVEFDRALGITEET